MDSVKPKVLVYYTPSHKVMFDNYFKPSFDKYLKKDFEMVIQEGEQLCESASFRQDGWNETVINKVKFVQQFMENDESDFFVFSDVDVMFFSPMKEILTRELGDYDMAFEKGYPYGVCSGFFICKNNKRTKYFFKHILDDYDISTGDQNNYNRLLERYSVRYKILPKNFFSIWRTMVNWHFKIWKYPRYEIDFFHATYSRGVENKCKLLESFKKWQESNSIIKNSFDDDIRDMVQKELDVLTHNKQMSVSEYLYLCKNIIDRGACNLLVFGVGHDSRLWLSVNKNGQTVFLENDDKWIGIAKKENPDIRVFKVNYTTKLSNINNDIKKFNNKDVEFLKMQIPEEVSNVLWDVIIVDAPLGSLRHADAMDVYGRSQSIYASSQLSGNDTSIFLHDSDRIAEKVWAKLLIGDKYHQVETISHYIGAEGRCDKKE